MSSKVDRNTEKKQTKSQRLDRMARKKEERAIRAAHKKEKKMHKYLKDDENFASFSLQLSKLGLQLREIPGDGNCLFRALGDQLEGHCRSHLKHRRDVVQFMSDHRQDFEPFVEDDVPFDRHVQCIGSPGTYAGNDAIVAFARLHQLTVVIHQLNSPIWEIHGSEKGNRPQIHISYHNGDHYSSVRRLGDKSECPANIKFLNGQVVSQNVEEKQPYHAQPSENNSVNYNSSFKDDMADETDELTRTCLTNIALATGCKDRELLQLLYEENQFDVESTIAALLQIMSGNSSVNSSCHQTSSDSDTSSVLSSQECCMNPPSYQTDALSNPADDCCITGAKPKSKQESSSQKRRDRKMQKKARAEERHRNKVMGSCGDEAKAPSSDDDEIHTVITSNFKVLQI